MLGKISPLRQIPIKYEIPSDIKSEREKVKLIVYDVPGKGIKTLNKNNHMKFSM